MSANDAWSVILLDTGRGIEVNLPADQLVAAFTQANQGKALDAGQWWNPWPHVAIRLDRVVAISPRRSDDTVTPPAP